jgi:hypothetical protein
MFKIQRQPAWPPALDLSTVKDTLQYMEGDLRRVPELATAAQAIRTAISELEAAERRQAPKPYSVFSAKFMPRR